ncbi:MAG: gliding motility-associated protein GldE [Lentimicrobium sp.]|nr:gliding motility-associated protein GldE [Lentimicrobium sp.]
MEDPDPESSLQVLTILLNTFTGNFDPGVVISLVLMLVLLFMSAAVSASEIAFFSLNPANLNDLKNDNGKSSHLIQLLLEKPKRLLATILIANNFINVSIVIISSFVMARLFDFATSPFLGFLVQVVIVTSLLLIFGEIMPKIYASQHALKVAHLMARPMLTFRKIFYPLSTILVKSTHLIDKRIAHKGHEITIDDLSEALEITSTGNTTPDEERKILKGIVKFGDIAVREIMKPRIDVTSVEEKTLFTHLLATILDSGYSRIPVFHESFDHVTGILYIKDLLPHLNRLDDFNWQQLQRPAFFVPENKRISDLLQEFQEKKIHLAIVVDEFGGTSGIVTLEDILEEIVGEINDEFDIEADAIHFSKIDDNNYIFEGKTLLNDFCKVMGIEDRIFAEAKGESDTLAGLMLELAGKIPDTNEKFYFNQYVFKAENVDKRRIKRIHVSIVNE